MSKFFAELVDRYGNENAYRLGPYSTYNFRQDPMWMVFMLARYKFCAKMLNGMQSVLEVGCGDETGARMMLQNVFRLHGIDVNENIIAYNQKVCSAIENLSYSTHNMLVSPMQEKFDAAFSLDVIEHIEPEQEYNFLHNIAQSISEHGVFIVGTPNITANIYASEENKEEHINLKSHFTLKQSLLKHFYTVFIFSMNDEVVHTGFYPMAHYLFALATGVRRGSGGGGDKDCLFVLVVVWR